MTNEQRAEKLVRELGFDFDQISKDYIISLLEDEISNFHEGSSEYVRLLCGYLYCLGNISDIPLLKKAKYGINFDVGCMVDSEWIDSIENGGVEVDLGYIVRSRDEIIRDIVNYYKDFKASDLDDEY